MNLPYWAAAATCTLLSLSSPSQQTIDAKVAVAKAFENRDVIRAEKLKINAARAGKAESGALPATRVEIGDGSRPDVNGGEDLTLFQPIDIFGKTRANRSLGAATAHAAEVGLRQVMLDVQQETLTAFAQARAAKQRAQTAETQLSVSKLLLESTNRRIQGQSLPEVQRLRAEMEVDRAEQVVRDRTADLKAAEVRLGAVMGITQGTEVDADETFLDSPESFGDLSAQRPDLLSLGADAKIASAEARIARTGLFPDVELQGRRSTWDTPEQYGIRLQLVIPLWDYGAVRQRKKGADLQSASSLATLQDRSKMALREVQTADIEFKAATQSVAAYSHIVELSRTFLQKTQRAFELGAANIQDILDARRAWLESQDAMTDAELRRCQALIAQMSANGYLIAGKRTS